MNFTDFNNLKIQILRHKEFVPCTFLYLHLIRMRYMVRRVAEITEKSRVLTKIGSTQAQYIVRSSASLTFAVNNRQKIFSIVS